VRIELYMSFGVIKSFDYGVLYNRKILTL
jgi:hypothetical protein